MAHRMTQIRRMTTDLLVNNLLSVVIRLIRVIRVPFSYLNFPVTEFPVYPDRCMVALKLQ